jgi:hypothetical protein
MLGPGKYSTSIWTPWATMCTALVRYIRWSLKIAWKRTFSNDLTYAKVGNVSVIDGLHIVQGSTTPSTKPTLLETWDESERVISLEYDRKLAEPLGGITTAMADITLENTDGRFTPDQNATIGTAILPKRPVLAEVGFYADSTERTVPVFIGLSEMPRQFKAERTLVVQAKDYVEYLNNYPLPPKVYENKRSDEIIEDILKLSGFVSSSYELDQGLNTPALVYFTQTQRAGDRIKELCEAEEGTFFQDEDAILRFYNRRKYGTYPLNTSLWDIDPSDIIAWENIGSTEIINSVVINVNPRVLETLQEVWEADDTISLAGSETKTIEAILPNPVLNVAHPVPTTDYTVTNNDGSIDYTDSGYVLFSIDPQADRITITLENTTANTIKVTMLKLRATPATLTGGYTVSYEDATSINKYDLSPYTIDNAYIESETFANTMAEHVVNKYKDPLRKIRLTIQGQPHFQVRDKIRAKALDTDDYTTYRILQIQGTLTNGLFIQDVIVREIGDNEYDS